MNILLSILTILPLIAPHTWNIDDAADEHPGYFRGEQTYTQTFRIEKDAQHAYVLCFDGVNQEAWVKLNNREVGYHAGGYTRFSFDVTDYVQSGENTLAVLVSNAYNADIAPLSADFTFFGGIYRPAYLRVTGKTYIAEDGVCVRSTKVNHKKAIIEVETEIVNDTKSIIVEHTLYNPDGKEVKRIRVQAECLKKKPCRLAIKEPQLWSPDSPQRYTIVTRLIDRKNGQVCDENRTPIGLRYYRFDPNTGFYLNGQHLKLVGTGRHQCEQGYGNALTDAQHRRDIQMIKNMGANFVRISHYPQSRMVMDMCDSLGLLCSVEIPLVNAITETEAFRRNCLLQLEEMIKQNRNHPSVILWGCMNEVLLRPPYPKSSDKDSVYLTCVHNLAVALHRRCKELDQERYTMIAYNDNYSYNRLAGLYDIPDVIGLNLYHGWYSGTIGTVSKCINKCHNDYPQKPIFITEYGADCDTRLRSDKPTRFDYTEDYALYFHQCYWPVIRDSDYIAGGALWNFNDFHSEQRGGAVPHYNLKGIVTTHRVPKLVYYYYQTELLTDSVKRQTARLAMEKYPLHVSTLTSNTKGTRCYLLGTNRIFIDPRNELRWYPMDSTCMDGGHPYYVKTRFGRLPASDHDILGTNNDPIYQTAWIGAKHIRIPLPDGRYRVVLHWAELQQTGEPVKSVYNLGNDAVKEEFTEREMTIYVNDRMLVQDLNLTSQYGAFTAHEEAMNIDVSDGTLHIRLEASKGESLLNAVQIIPL